MTEPSSTLEQLVDTYCTAWSDPDPARRREILARVWGEGATYTDPLVHAAGAEELLAHIDSVLTQRPGAIVIRTSRIDGHHGVARFEWRVVEADGNRLPTGIDFIEVDAAGRIARVVGFFGPL
ncbi:nuclear transport factor 2 family protein [Nocardia sp. NPDC057668]|uniref:nuclear transport factor 2 family protein n=1 Tax=Nocardia sp. NPDC057668 TaxID=3346202 RepID=UPI00366A976C